ncbi:hypothetical protein [Kinneretia aquatilis]|uniref:hypothetical protein n=1 Tax=Kinneretia aquatilis TaxID=2070761 RepID=UPI0014952463|nr:hypothetical protein [Paucibacter aquatile]WIV98330.1 hypothetical protein K9V56_002120 [Paucibacter aquatile]
MQPAQAIGTFKVLAAEVVAELELAVAKRDERYPNADVALRNVRQWLTLAHEGKLPGSYRPDFAVYRSELDFGPVEQRMYDLQTLYVEHIRDAG